MVFFDFFAFSSSPQAVTSIKNAQTAIKRNPNPASIWRRFTIGENILIQNSQPRRLPITAESVLRLRVFHTENAICITKIPTEVQIIFDFHFFTFSSSLDEKRSLMTPIIKKITAIAMKKFLIWNAIVVNASITPSDPQVLGKKKNERRLQASKKEESSLLSVVHQPTRTSRILLSTANVVPILRNREIKRRIIRVSIGMKK